MVVAEMSKPSVKVSVSDDEDSSDVSNVEESDDEAQSMDGDDADKESTASQDNDKDVMMVNEGWADSVAKILGSNKPKNKKTLVLSRAKKHSDIIKKEKVEKPEFEVIGETKEVKPDVKTEVSAPDEPPSKKKKHEKSTIRVKPNILEKDRERLLSKIATKGVVQLFNAVRNQQKSLEKELERDDLTETKKEKILKKFDKRTFLDTLMGQTKSVVVDAETKSMKNEVKAEEKPKWSALRDDFMMGAKMKDWDKDSESE